MNAAMFLLGLAMGAVTGLAVADWLQHLPEFDCPDEES